MVHPKSKHETKAKRTTGGFSISGMKSKGVKFGLQVIHLKRRKGIMYILGVSISASSDCRRLMNGLAELYKY